MKLSRLALLMTLGLVVTHVVSSYAQTRSDFSGRWALDDPDSAASTGPRMPFGRECQISQTPSSLTITMGTRAMTYETDDKIKRTVVDVGKLQVDVSTRATWHGGTLVIVRKVGTQPEATLRLSLQDGKLVVESTDSAISAPGIGLKTLYRRVR